MAKFGRTIKMETLFGNDPKWKYENITFEEDAETMEEAIKMVEKDIADYVKEKKAQMKKKENEEVPFEEVAGVKMLRNK